MSADLPQLILAAIEATEQDAQAAAKFGGATWSVEPFTPSSPDALPAVVWVVDEAEDGMAMVNGDARARHIVRNDPDAAVRRCAAHRKLIALHPQDPELGWLCQLCGGEGQNMDCTYPCDTLRLIAESYGVTEIPADPAPPR